MNHLLLVVALFSFSGATFCSQNISDEEIKTLYETQERVLLFNAIATFNVNDVKNIVAKGVNLTIPCNLPEALWRKIGTAAGGMYTPSVSPLYLALKLLNESNKTDPSNSALREIIKVLLDNGANPNRTENKTDNQSIPYLNERPLRIAIKKRDEQAIELLLKAGADPLIDVREPDSLLSLVMKNEDFPLFKLLLSNPKKVIDFSTGGSRLLFNAIAHGAFKHVELLIAHNAKVTVTTYGSFTPLDNALEQGYAGTYLDALIKGSLGKKDRLKKAYDRFRAYAQLADACKVPPYVLKEIVEKVPNEEDVQQDLAALLLQEVNEPNSVLGGLSRKRAQYLKVLLVHSKEAAIKLITEDSTQLFNSLVFKETSLVRCTHYYGRQYETELETKEGRSKYLQKSLEKVKQQVYQRAREIFSEVSSSTVS